jgi:hypothetical protein
MGDLPALMKLIEISLSAAISADRLTSGKLVLTTRGLRRTTIHAVCSPIYLLERRSLAISANTSAWSSEITGDWDTCEDGERAALDTEVCATRLLDQIEQSARAPAWDGASKGGLLTFRPSAIRNHRLRSNLSLPSPLSGRPFRSRRSAGNGKRRAVGHQPAFSASAGAQAGSATFHTLALGQIRSL